MDEKIINISKLKCSNDKEKHKYKLLLKTDLTNVLNIAFIILIN